LDRPLTSGITRREIMRQPTRFQQRTLWNAATGVAILIIGVLLVGLVWLTGRVFGFLQPVLIPLIVAGIVAYVLDPVVRLLENAVSAVCGRS
jgi:predicted PurR-regulated permease PerM